jgi:hypothetical protein
VALFYPDFAPNVTPWQLLLIFYAITVTTFVIVAYGNKVLPMADTICAAFTMVTILVVLIALSTKAEVGRASPSTTLVGSFKMPKGRSRCVIANEDILIETIITGGLR